jgi:hypothetical protein
LVARQPGKTPCDAPHGHESRCTAPFRCTSWYMKVKLGLPNHVIGAQASSKDRKTID